MTNFLPNLILLPLFSGHTLYKSIAIAEELLIHNYLTLFNAAVNNFLVY